MSKTFEQKIADIQDKIGVMQKDTKGYNYKYFDINQLLEKLHPLLKAEKILLTQPIQVENGVSILATILTDLDSDEQANEMVSRIILPSDVKPQDMGSAITYYRRYSIVSLFGIQAEDDDGKTAHDSKTKAAGKPAFNTVNDLPM